MKKLKLIFWPQSPSGRSSLLGLFVLSALIQLPHLFTAESGAYYVSERNVLGFVLDVLSAVVGNYIGVVVVRSVLVVLKVLKPTETIEKSPVEIVHKKTP